MNSLTVSLHNLNCINGFFHCMFSNLALSWLYLTISCSEPSKIFNISDTSSCTIAPIHASALYLPSLFNSFTLFPPTSHNAISICSCIGRSLMQISHQWPIVWIPQSILKPQVLFQLFHAYSDPSWGLVGLSEPFVVGWLALVVSFVQSALVKEVGLEVLWLVNKSVFGLYCFHSHSVHSGLCFVMAGSDFLLLDDCLMHYPEYLGWCYYPCLHELQWCHPWPHRCPYWHQCLLGFLGCRFLLLVVCLEDCSLSFH